MNLGTTCRKICVVGVVLLGSGCITPSEKKRLNNELFSAQSRLLNLEKQLSVNQAEVKTTGSSASRRIASTKADLDKINRELGLIRGELDSLKVAVKTGKLPGSSEDGLSVGGRLTSINDRVEALEESQEELLEAISKAGAKSTSKRKSATTVAELQKAFDANRFTHVTKDAGDLLKTVPEDDKEQVRFLYAESLYKLGKLREAALKFNDFIDAKPTDRYLPQAQLRMGDCFRHLGDMETAKLYYGELLKNFPKSEAAQTAEERLAELS